MHCKSDLDELHVIEGRRSKKSLRETLLTCRVPLRDIFILLAIEAFARPTLNQIIRKNAI